jgi:hypothetical protein
MISFFINILTKSFEGIKPSLKGLADRNKTEDRPYPNNEQVDKSTWGKM